MADFSKTAFVFPGQGSQGIGMGKDIVAAYPIAKETIEQADAILGLKLSQLMFEGPEETLNDTAITQPAMYVCSIAMLRVLQQEMPEAKPIFVAGHSLGEFSALTAAGVLSFENGLKLVRVRAEAMKDAGAKSPGGMAAILGLDIEQVEQVVASAAGKSGKAIVIANDNCPGQIVISGDKEALDIAVELAKEQGARRSILLPVSVATHSPLMQAAKEQFTKALHETNFTDAEIPIYANVCACATRRVDEIRSNLEQQLTNSVRWSESIQAMIADGAETFVEIGSKKVLTGLLRRISRDVKGMSIQDLASLQKFMQIND